MTVSTDEFGVTCRQVYRKVSKQTSMQVSKLLCKKVAVTKFSGLLDSGYVMVVGVIIDVMCNAADLNQSKGSLQIKKCHKKWNVQYGREGSALRIKKSTI